MLSIKIVRYALLLGLVLTFAAILPAMAQGETLRLTVHKDFGYNLGSQMRGRFTFTVSGPQDLASATLIVDGRVVASVNQAPFDFKLDTADYGFGSHVIAATARTPDGRTLQSNDVAAEFVETGQAAQSLMPIVAVILGIAVLVSVLMAWLTSRSSGRSAQGKRSYGSAGGALCSRCRRPFPLALWQANLIGGKLARCPYCGKWQLARRASRHALEAAEEAEVAAGRPDVPEASPEEVLRRQIEESRYGS